MDYRKQEYLRRKREYIRRKKIIKRVNRIIIFTLFAGSMGTVTYAKNLKLDIINEAILKEQEIANREYVGVNDIGDKYSYNADIISKKLLKYDYSSDEKIVFLTFDDGPSSSITPKVLDVLKENKVKATFFILGENINSNESKSILKRIFNEGHSLANHTYTHDYKKLYPNGKLDSKVFIEEVNKTNEVIKETLGVNFTSRVIRCPGGYYTWGNMQNLDNYLNDNDKVIIDWNASVEDAAKNKKATSDKLYKDAISDSKDKDVVVLLMHDSNGKEETVKSLDKIIKYYKENGYKFKTLV